MKNVITLFLVSILFNNCEYRIDINKIKGNWKVINFESNTPKISPLIIKEAETNALSSYYLFKNDSLFIMSSDNELKGENGKYEFITNSNTIKLIYDNREKGREEYEIKKLNYDYMEWTQDMGGIGSLTITLQRK
jgi:hypothetical protein